MKSYNEEHLKVVEVVSKELGFICNLIVDFFEINFIVIRCIFYKSKITNLVFMIM